MTAAASRERGVTLIEMMIVVALISLLAAIMFPSVSSGIDSLRMRQAADSISGFLNSGMDRAERRRDMVEVTIDKKANCLTLLSVQPGFDRRLEMPDGIRILDVLPARQDNPNEPRRFVIYPGGGPPRFAVLIVNRRNERRLISMNPVTGVPEVERPAE